MRAYRIQARVGGKYMNHLLVAENELEKDQWPRAAAPPRSADRGEVGGVRGGGQIFKFQSEGSLRSVIRFQ